MTSAERRAGLALSSIFALRMLGLFLILPVFALHAQSMPSGQNVTLVGLALGAYGLTQALFQMPFGVLSDRIGRKPVIVFGLLLFSLGSFVAAFSDDLYALVGGRILQGAGAISAAVTALAADLTRPQHLTKTMAMIGGSIALVFALSMVGAPILYGLIRLPGIFLLTGGLALLAIGVLWRAVPDVPVTPRQPDAPQFLGVLLDRTLMRLNFGVFVLHLVQTAMWVIIPGALVAAGLPLGAHWQVYLPAVLLSFAVMVPAIMAAERRGRMKQILLAAIGLLLLVQLGFGFFAGGVFLQFFRLLFLFIAFNVLEAILPSLISRCSPHPVRGAAFGLYNTIQSLGLFLGGLMGGMLAHHGGVGFVWLACAAFVSVWLVLAVFTAVPALSSGSARQRTA